MHLHYSITLDIYESYESQASNIRFKAKNEALKTAIQPHTDESDVI